MTGNQIAYYKARNERRNMRLQRKETKRHNLESEVAGRTQAAASMLGAQAAAQQAGIREKEYQLGWEKEYGLPYGSDPNDTGNYHGVEIGDQYYLVPNNAMPQSYVTESNKAIEYETKAGYERASTLSKKAEAAEKAANAINRILGAFGQTVSLVQQVGGEAGHPTLQVIDQHVPGTDLIIYGD